jgi:hypothetical protein
MKRYLIGSTISLLAITGSTAAQAATITVAAVDSGWYDSTGFHLSTRTNYLAGEVGGSTPQFRNFFVFDLSGVSGVVTTATLRLDTASFSSFDPSEDYSLFDVTTPSTTLRAGGSGMVATYADLGSGVSYGTRTYTNVDDNLVRDIKFNAAGIAAVQAGLGGDFAIGGTVTTLRVPVDDEHVFGGSGSGVRELVLETVAVPEPLTISLFGIGIVASTAARFRRPSTR